MSDIEISLRITRPTGVRRQGVGSTEHDTTSLDGIQALPDHGNNGSRGHILDQTREKGLSLKISVICKDGDRLLISKSVAGLGLELTPLKVLWGCMDKLKCDQLEAALFKPADDLSEEGALNAIRL